MPPAAPGQASAQPAPPAAGDTDPRNPPFPLNLGFRSLAGLPFPLQVVLVGPMLPVEVAVTGVKILQHTEALLGEAVLMLRGLRPAVVTASQAYVDGHFDPLLKTFDQIAQGTNTIAVIWAPFTAVRDVVVPRNPMRAATVVSPRVVIGPPSVPTASRTGDLGGWVRTRAGSLPGVGLFFGRTDDVDPEETPVAGYTPTYQEPVVDAGPGRGAEVSPRSAVLDLIRPVVPGPLKRLFGN